MTPRLSEAELNRMMKVEQEQETEILRPVSRVPKILHSVRDRNNESVVLLSDMYLRTEFIQEQLALPRFLGKRRSLLVRIWLGQLSKLFRFLSANYERCRMPLMPKLKATLRTVR